MKSYLSILVLFIFQLAATAQINGDTISSPSNSFPVFGTEYREASFFRDRYLYNDFVHYLDNLDDFVTYQSETAGDFNLPDLTLFSVSGNSYRWNSYYLNGYRIDNRLFPGSNFYYPDITTHSFDINQYNSAINFYTETKIPESATLRYNIGGIGGINPSTEALVNLYHLTASQRLYKPIEYRKKMKGSGSLYLNYDIPIADKKYSQQLYANFGTRMLIGFDETGINSYYPEDFYKLQLSGDLPFKFGDLFDKTNYLGSFSKRQNLFSELNFGRNETAMNSSSNISFYGSKETGSYKYVTGFTLALNTIRHNDLNFYRNLIDQDGEAFEPWYPDANALEFSYYTNVKKKFGKYLDLTFDSYKTFIDFRPTEETFYNPVYAKNVNLPFQSLYVYNWETEAFISGLFENTLSLVSHKKISEKLDFKANIDLTLDAMLISSKSKYDFNWQGFIGFKYAPQNWFSMELNVGRMRIPYNFDHIRYFSDEYLNGDQYFWKDLNNDQQFQEGEKSDYFHSTGGKYHSMAPNLKQQSYFIFDLPISFHFGRHEFMLFNTYKKYNNMWTTRFEKTAENYGYTKTIGENELFFYNPGAINYVIDYYPSEYMTTDKFYNFATNSPYFLSSVIKYQYTTEKFLFSISWCSYLMCGISTLGNGPLHNNVDVFSETSANPNIDYKLIGRLDQERALIARMLLSYKATKNLSFAFSFKFKDGQAFTNFNTELETDTKGNKQLAIWADRTKGINPFNGDFGSREDAFFNVELRTSYTGKIAKLPYELQFMVYNLYDFGTELVEYTFQPDNSLSRYAMELNIPRGFILTGKIYF